MSEQYAAADLAVLIGRVEAKLDGAMQTLAIVDTKVDGHAIQIAETRVKVQQLEQERTEERAERAAHRVQVRAAIGGSALAILGALVNVVLWLLQHH